MKNLANIITGSRILFSLLLIFTIPFTIGFYLIYFIGGISDVVDGIIARKTNSISKFGSKLDSIADLIFVIVALIKILPALVIPMWLWIWVGIIIIIKISNLICSKIYLNKYQFLHTTANKITGFLLFLIPFFLPIIDIIYCGFIACIIATFAAIQEGHQIRTMQKYIMFKY